VVRDPLLFARNLKVMAVEPFISLRVEHLVMAYGSTVVMRDVNFAVSKGQIFLIIGGSGSGKSTLLRHLLGLEEPAGGKIFYGSLPSTEASEGEWRAMLRRVGVCYQSGALFSSMTLLENVALPLVQYTKLTRSEVRRIARMKLGLVGLRGFDDYEPASIS